MKKYGKRLLLLAILIVLFPVALLNTVSAQSCDNECPANDLSCINSRIADCQRKIGTLQGQANTLSNQIAQFNAQIKLTELKITQTNEQIELLGGRITQLGDSLTRLSDAFSNRAVETYKMSKTGEPAYLILSSSNLRDVVSRFHYLKIIQEADRDLLVRLQTAQNTYKEQKTDQEELQETLIAQKQQLNSQKAAKNSLLAATRNDEKRYQELLSQAKTQQAAFRRFISSQGGATILNNQTKCDSWGCYYNQRDSQWGNIGLGGSSYSVAEYGCLITSISMLASHYGKGIKPSDIAVNPNYFVPGTGFIYWTAEGMPFSIRSASKNSLDSELSKGPVIVGLYGGPDHFIVILRKEGDNYIMHDPFLENGGNRPLTDKYSVGDINSLRLVTFY